MKYQLSKPRYHSSHFLGMFMGCVPMNRERQYVTSHGAQRQREREETEPTNKDTPRPTEAVTQAKQHRHRSDKKIDGSARDKQRYGCKDGHTTEGGNDHTPTHHQHACHHKTPRKRRIEKRGIGYKLPPGSNTTAQQQQTHTATKQRQRQ